MYWKVIGNHSLGFQKSLQILSLNRKLFDKTGVIKLNVLFSAVCLQNYCLKSYDTLLNYAPGLFKPKDLAFCPLLAFQGQFYDPKWVRFSLFA